MNNKRTYRDTPVLSGYSSSISSGTDELMGFPSGSESEDEITRPRAKTPFEAADNASESENQSDMDIELSNLRLQPDLYRGKIATPKPERPGSVSVSSPFSKATAPTRVGSEETIPSEHSFVPDDGLEAKHYIKSNEKLSELADLDETGDLKKGSSRNLKKPRAMRSEDEELQPSKRIKKSGIDPETLKNQQTYYSVKERREEVYIISSILQEIASLSTVLQSGSMSDPRMVNDLFASLNENLADNYAFLYHNEREYLDTIEETLRTFVNDHSETEYASKAREILDTFFNPGSKEPAMLTGGKRKKTRKSKKSKKNKKTRSKKQKGGKEDFGTYKDGSSVFKDKNGYYIDEWDNDKQVIYKKYLKSWKPVISDTRLILDKKTKKWKIVKSKKTKTMKKSSKKTKTSRCPNGTRKNKKSGKCEKK